MLVKHLKDNRLTTFRTNDDGFGCQTWTAAVVKSLTQAGYIDGHNYLEDRKEYLDKAVPAEAARIGQPVDRPAETGATFAFELPSRRDVAWETYEQELDCYDQQESVRRDIAIMEAELLGLV